MPLLAIPNISEGRDQDVIRTLVADIADAGVRVLDVHSDRAHHRSVFTVTGLPDAIVASMTRLAEWAATVDLRAHSGVHPRLGALDVCPIVPFDEPMSAAIEVAHATGEAIAERTSLPVYFYQEAARRETTRELPSLRRGGLHGLIERASEVPPDAGSREINERTGVVCVGARTELIAFNVWLATDAGAATSIAARVRESAGGLAGVRALGVGIDDTPTSQVAMNLVEPATTGIEEAFEAVEKTAGEIGAGVVATEIVGLVREDYLPPENSRAARLLLRPGRSVELAIRSR
jgi:glutamate formiminotransferase